MKKTILAVAIPALFAASAQAATVYDADGVTAELYGRMQFDISDAGGDDSDLDGVGSARMGFKAKSEIASGVYGLARGEWQIRAENSGESAKQLSARHIYAGFEFDDAGSVVFGQTDTAFYQAVAATDIFNTYGYEAFTAIEDGRQEGQIVYSGEFGGFYVGASYQFRDENFKLGFGNPDSGIPAEPTQASLDQGYAATLGYNFDFGLGLYGGYHVEKFDSFENGAVNGADKKNMALSATYSWEDLYLGAVYAATDLDGAELKGYDLVASYDINAVSLYTGYAAQEGKGDASDLGDTAKAFKLGAAYKFNSNMKAWAEYLNNGLEGADNEWTIAVQYNF
ncbi:porin [Agarivorans albus]|uniref:Putative outer membrane protein n=1 Tax=Agarivorans albus MKT 106 TaxID=1331007 RepID=R9PJ28_AGAAL|nr:porin [Agarivorans albus]GAD01379.1 putative outer membrane protein [Agarivorans albus MKT 106]